MTRIAFISTMSGSRWGGSEVLWSQTAARLADSQMTVGVNVPWWPEPVAQIEALARGGCQVEYRDDPASTAKPPHLWLESFRPDFTVISQGAQADGLLWMQECLRLRLRYSVIVQCANEDFWPLDEHAAQLAEAYLGAAVCYFVSQRNLDFVQSQLAVFLPHARVVRNPFNVPYDVSVPWPETSDVLELACVARLDPGAKGQDLLFEVLRLEKWRRRPVRVSLFGGGPYAKTLQRLQQLYDLSGVRFAGYAADIAAVWASHHALVLPSRYEGLPLALVEAMLCGRPSIVTDVAGNTELVEDGLTGFVAPAPTVTLLDAALERAWDSRARWREIGGLAARRVREAVPADPARCFADELKRLI